MGFLKWQKGISHAPLTNLKCNDPREMKLKKKSVKICFETVQKFMGQRESKRLNWRINELLTLAHQDPVIRTDVYIGIIKQLTDNPERGCNGKAWELMAMCLLTFPPSSDFEDYLEAYFRTNDSDAKRHKCKFLLRQRCYEKQAGRVFDGRESQTLFFACFLPSLFVCCSSFRFTQHSR
jgi:hypothetical protein